MSKNLLFRLVVLVTAMMCALGAAAAEAYACFTSADSTLRFFYDNYRSSRTGTTYDLNTGYNPPGWYTDGTNSSVTRVVFNSSFASARPTSTLNWFMRMENLQSILNMQYLNTSQVTDMSCMFYYCKGLTNIDLSHFNTQKVTDMNSMFYRCTGLTSLDLSHFNTANVTNIANMFGGCTGLTSLDLSSFNTANVISMAVIFQDCSALTSLDVSHFNTANVQYMTGMFWGCSGLTALDVSNFKTGSAISLESMFSGCTGLTSLDLSSFNTTNVTRMNSMFYECTALTTIYVSSGWSTAAVTESSDMFTNCYNLVGGKGTTWNASNPTDKTYAHIDGGPSNPGYFTAKNAGLRGDVNGDGSVNISDVTALIDYLLSGNASGINLSGADCNKDGDVDIADVTALIDYLLSDYW